MPSWAAMDFAARKIRSRVCPALRTTVPSSRFAMPPSQSARHQIAALSYGKAAKSKSWPQGSTDPLDTLRATLGASGEMASKMVPGNKKGSRVAAGALGRKPAARPLGWRHARFYTHGRRDGLANNYQLRSS